MARLRTTRRTLFATVLATVAFRPRRGDAAALLALLRDPAGAARIGAAYLRTQDGRAETDAARLTALVLDGWERRGPTLRAALDRRLREDFAADRVVLVEGWVLARTEARLCALVALGATPAP